MSEPKPLAPRKQGKNKVKYHAHKVESNGAVVVRRLGKRGRKGSGAGRFSSVFAEDLAPTHMSANLRRDSLTELVTGVDPKNRALLLRNVRSGLNTKSFDSLAKHFRCNEGDMASVLSIPRATLTRRKKEGIFKPSESDKIVRFAQLLDAAIDMMNGDEGAAANWMKVPLDILGGETPLVHASTEIGARNVEDLIGRIQHGVFS